MFAHAQALSANVPVQVAHLLVIVGPGVGRGAPHSYFFLSKMLVLSVLVSFRMVMDKKQGLRTVPLFRGHVLKAGCAVLCTHTNADNLCFMHSVMMDLNRLDEEC